MATTAVNSVSVATKQRSSSFAPWLSRIVMVPPTLTMILIGLRFIINPTYGVAQSGVTLSTPEAVTDTRVIGGLALSIALVLGNLVVSRSRLRTGHLTIIAMMALILSVRLFGFAVDGTTLAMGGQKVKFTGELVFLILNSIGFWLQSRISKREGTRQ
jgi:hypothetical protein